MLTTYVKDNLEYDTKLFQGFWGMFALFFVCCHLIWLDGIMYLGAASTYSTMNAKPHFLLCDAYATHDYIEHLHLKQYN